jgi:ubiquinone/menaquinone biosynthesis C-methylase UbiE
MEIEQQQISALDAKLEAQKLSWAPFVFQATLALRDLGVLEHLFKNKTGATISEMEKALGLSRYGLQILLETGYTANIVDQLDAETYSITKIGHFILKDKLTRVNMDFTQDVCYKGLFHLKEAITKGTPAGLKELGDWATIYEGLKDLEPHVQKSWFEFDHFYSDDSLNEALEIFFKSKPKRVLDVGGNTGKWAMACCHYDPDVEVTIIDLPGQIGMAKKNVEEAGLSDRISYFPMNMLAPDKQFPEADLIWMSQFLDCFSEEEIVKILKHTANSMKDHTRLMIMETFWDNQRFEAAAYSLTATSVYFTVMANGNSKMYGYNIFIGLVEKAGLMVEETFNEVGISHTILKLKKA